ncbi:MAG TPA: hypothetical protein VFA85_18855, partial [Terriglobales bacterium]|nr:hypothetical protein [Terriglobales bacterium]
EDGGRDRDRRDIPDYRHPDDRNVPPPTNIPRPNSQSVPAKPSSTPAVQSPAGNYATMTLAEYRVSGVSNQMSPAVRNVIAALRAMPPEARQRQVDSGRYNGFSREEQQLLIEASKIQ